MVKKISLDRHPHVLMVYGTLKRGEGNDVILERTGCLFGGECVTLNDYMLADGGFPRLSKIPPASRSVRKGYIGKVKGELWYMTEEGLRACDRLEGHPRFYKREEVDVAVKRAHIADPADPSAVVKAWLYIINGFPVGAQFIEADKDGILEWHGPALPKCIQG